jgi:hypothetical protein
MEDKDYYNSKDFKRDMKEIVWENRIQTLAVILIFFFGIETLKDIAKKK